MFMVTLWRSVRLAGLRQAAFSLTIKLPFAPFPGLQITLCDNDGEELLSERFDRVNWDAKEQGFDLSNAQHATQSEEEFDEYVQQAIRQGYRSRW